MDDEMRAASANGGGCAGTELPMGTFKPCGAMPKPGSEQIENSELIGVADLNGSVYRESVRLFCWATGAREQSEITDDALERFCSVVRQVDHRFGTNPRHFEMTVEHAVALAQRNNGRSRSPSTVARHRNRLSRLRVFAPPRFETRIRSPGWFDLDAAEATLLGGAKGAGGHLFVERLGIIRCAVALRTVDLMMGSASPKALAPVLIQEAAQVVSAVQEQGRAFIATHHDDFALIIPRFWNALSRGGLKHS